MAEINLRTYVQEIDDLIEEGQHLEEAIAHCRHILKTYPKHINTYRLLGKAYLESKRFGDAGDIFQRVLSAIPNDFVSHVGMAIIREDEGNLDAAIWHMERSSEAQPGNAAIEEELKRLIGKRDGIEPQRVRPSRGALARMYYHGELYSYAISELQTALEEDPDRPDLQLLLADTYWRTDQRLEAADLCGQILEKLPFCFLANQITAALLQASGKPEESAINLRRLISLDPYMAFIETPIENPTSIDASVIQLERLAWAPGQPLPSSESTQPDWAASLGVDLRGEEAKVPDRDAMPSWLKSPSSSADEETSQVSPIHPFAGAKASPGTDIPEWMQEAGWVESTGEATEGPMEFGEESEVETEPPSPDRPLATADLPSWLSEISSVQPVREEATPIPQPTVPEAHPPTEADDSQELPAWIRELTPSIEEDEEEPIEFAPDEERDLDLAAPGIEPAKPSLAEEAEIAGLEEILAEDESMEAEIPDYPPWLEPSTPGATDTIVTWLGDKSLEKSAAAEDIPTWMRGTGPLEDPTRRTRMASEQVTPEELPAAPTPEFEDLSGLLQDDDELVPEEEIPASPIPVSEPAPTWLDESAEMEDELPTEDTVQPEEAPDWLTEATLKEEAPLIEKATSPSWLDDFDEEFVEETQEELEASEPLLEAMEKPPDWLSEVIRVDDEEEPEEKPDWLEGVIGAETILGEEVAAEIEDAPDWLSEMSLVEEVDTSPTTEEKEEPPQWLKGLADTEISSVVEEQTDEEAPPEWVTQDSFPEPEEEIYTEQETPEWLQELSIPSPKSEEPSDISMEPPVVSAAVEEPPGWAQDLSAMPTEEKPAAEEIAEEFLEFASEEEAIPETEAPDWLMEMDQEPLSLEGVTDEAVEEPSASLPIEESLPKADVPDWLRDLDETPAEAEGILDEPVHEKPEFAIEEEALASADIPDWLEEFEEAPAEAKAMPAEPVSEELEITIEEEAEATDEAPDWLEEFDKAPSEAEAILEEPASEVPMLGIKEEIIPEDEAPIGFEEIGEVAFSEEPVTDELIQDQFEATDELPAIPAEEAPDWLQDMVEVPEGEIRIEEPIQEISETVTGEDISTEPEAEEWLKEISETPSEVKPVAEGQLEAIPEPAPGKPDLPVDGTPVWLEEIEEVGAETIETEEVILEPPPSDEELVSLEEAPDWLREFSEPESELESKTPGELEKVEKAQLMGTPESEEPFQETPDWIQEIEMGEEEAVGYPSEDIGSMEELHPDADLAVEEFEEEPEWRPEFLPEDQAIEVEPRASEKIKTEGPKMAFEESFDWLQESAMEVSPEPETLSQPAELELAMEKTGDLFESIEDPLDDAEVFSFLDNLAASGVVDEADAIFEGTGLVEPSPVTDSAEEKLIEEHILPEELDESLDWLEQLAGEEPVEDFSPPIFVEGLDEEEEAEIPDWLEEVAERPVQAPSDRIDVDEVDVIEEFTEEPAPTAPSLSSIETIISKPIREEEIFPEEPAEEYPEEMFSEPSPSDASIEDKAEWLWTREAEEKPPIGEEVAAAISEPEIPEAEISEIEPEAEFEEVSAGTLESGDKIAHPIQEPAIDPHTAMLNAARYALEIGQIEEALGHYSDLIEEKVEMESVIQDLRIAIGKTPREPMLWQILGDALMKVGQLSDAIDAYRRGMEAV